MIFKMCFYHYIAYYQPHQQLQTSNKCKTDRSESVSNILKKCLRNELCFKLKNAHIYNYLTIKTSNQRQKYLPNKSKQMSKRNRQVSELEAADYLKRPRTKISDPNKDLKKAYEKNKQFDDPKFDHFKQLRQYRKHKDVDSLSEHGGTDDEQFDVKAQFKKKGKKKANISYASGPSSDSDQLDQPKKDPKKNEKPVKKPKITKKGKKVLNVQKNAAIEQKPTEPEQNIEKEAEQVPKMPQEGSNSPKKNSQLSPSYHSSESKSSSKASSDEIKANKQAGPIKRPDEQALNYKFETPKKSPKSAQQVQAQKSSVPDIEVKVQTIVVQQIVPQSNIGGVKSEEENKSDKHSSDLSKKSVSKSSKKDSGKAPSEEEQVDLAQRLAKAVADRQESDKKVKLKTFKKKRGRPLRNRSLKKTKTINKTKKVENVKIKEEKPSKPIKSILKQSKKQNNTTVQKEDDIVKEEPQPKKVTIQIAETEPQQQAYLPPKTRGHIIVKQEDEDFVPELRRSARKPEKKLKKRKQKFTQMNLKGQVADMSKEVPLDTSKKQKEQVQQDVSLKLEEGQTLIKGFMKSKLEQSDSRKAKIQMPKKNEKETVAQKKNEQSSKIVKHPRHGNLTIERKVVVESILLFCNPSILETSKNSKSSKKSRTKMVMMQSQEEEPAEYIIKRRRPEKQTIRRYKKVLYADSDEQDMYIPKIHKRSRRQLEEIDVPERRKNRKTYEDIMVKASDKNKSNNEISMIVHPQEQQ